MKNYIELKDLEVYKLSRELSRHAWEVYSSLIWQNKKIIGDQFVRSVDSVGANIAEGYRRYHFLEKIKFYYIARASLSEACEHWLELLNEGKMLKEDKMVILKDIHKRLSIKMTNFINKTYESKNK